MIKIGDKLYCFNIKDYENNKLKLKLTIGNLYTVKNISIYNELIIENDIKDLYYLSSVNSYYYKKYNKPTTPIIGFEKFFITIQQQRKLKLQKLNKLS